MDKHRRIHANALVRWNGDQSEGEGKSGTSYGISPTSDRVELGWVIAVDDNAEFCLTDSADAALARIEDLEALRCVVAGMTTDLTARQLLGASRVTSEMLESIRISLARPGLTQDQRTELQESRANLRGLGTGIKREQDRRYRRLWLEADSSSLLH